MNSIVKGVACGVYFMVIAIGILVFSRGRQTEGVVLVCGAVGMLIVLTSNSKSAVRPISPAQYYINRVNLQQQYYGLNLLSKSDESFIKAVFSEGKEDQLPNANCSDLVVTTNRQCEMINALRARLGSDAKG